MIGFTSLFIPNVLQKPTLIIIIFLMNHTMSKWKHLNFILNYFSKMYTS